MNVAMVSLSVVHVRMFQASTNLETIQSFYSFITPEVTPERRVQQSKSIALIVQLLFVPSEGTIALFLYFDINLHGPQTFFLMA